MRLITARKAKLCKLCPAIITSGDEYSPQRRSKAICYGCYHNIKSKQVNKPILVSLIKNIWRKLWQ